MAIKTRSTGTTVHSAGSAGPTEHGQDSEWLVSGDEMGEIVRSKDWSATPLGPRADWPLELRTVVNLVLGSKLPMALFWGRELLSIYNEAYRQIAVDGRAHAIGRSARETWPEVWHINEPLFAAVMDRGESVISEDQLWPILRDGRQETAYFTLCYSPVRNEDGAIFAALVTFQKATKRVADRCRPAAEAERALEVFEHGEACHVLDSEFRYVLINHTHELVSGRTREETLGRRIWDVWPETADPRLKFWDVYHRVMRDRVPEAFEEYLPPRNLWAEIQVIPTHEGGIAAFFRRVNDRKRAEEALKRREIEFRVLIDNLYSGVALVDAAGRFTLYNARFLRLFGLAGDADVKNVNSQDWSAWKVFDPAGRLLHLDDHPVRRVARTHEPVRNQMVGVQLPTGGDLVWILVSAAPLLTDEGAIEHIICTYHEITNWKRAEDALRESEERFRTLADNIAQFAWIANQAGSIVWYNQRWFDYTGTTLAEMQRSGWQQVLHPDHAQRVEEKLRRCFETGESWEDTFPLRGKDGAHRWFLSRAIPIRDESGRVVRWFGTNTDVTAQRATEEALRRSETRLRERAEELEIVMDVAPVAIWVAEDPKCLSIHGNATANRFYEADPGENVSATSQPNDASARRHVFVDGREADAHELPMQRAAATGIDVRDAEFEILMPSGTKRSLFGSARPLHDANNAVRGCVGAFVDITERKRSEQELRAERDFTEAVLNTTASVVIVLDREGRIVRFNKSCEMTSGYREDEVLGNPFEILIPPDELPVVKQVFERLAAGESRVDHENHWEARDGTRRLLAWTNTAIVERNGRVKFVVSTGIDVTERRFAEEALRQANERLIEADQRKNEFLAVLSHELRNPLAPIRNSVYVLERAAPDDEKARRARQVIDRQAQHMTRLVEDLLDVTRISRGKINLQREHVDFNAIARRTAEDHREVYAMNGIELEVEGTEEPLWVNGDPTRLAQVVGNLLNNSAKFTARGGKTVLSLHADAVAAHAVLRVGDNGAGMSPDTLKRLFQPFVQATQTIERTRGGLGLGLALVKGLVEMHGGTVTAHSDGEGKGSEFVVKLPLQPAAQPKAIVASEPKPPAQSRRVLVVEDNVDAAESLREALELENHDVAVAYSGPEGIDVARRYRPDVVLCDIGLPGLDGYGVARALRADPDVEVQSAFLVALSGYALQEDIEKSKEAGFDRHLAKPPDMIALEKALSEATRQEGKGPLVG